jgi:hypothetical protein
VKSIRTNFIKRLQIQLQLDYCQNHRGLCTAVAVIDLGTWPVDMSKEQWFKIGGARTEGPTEFLKENF